MRITGILEDEDILKYLTTRQLLRQYEKAKRYLLQGYFRQVNFKLKQPKEKGIYSFRINKQFRAHCVYKSGELLVFEVDNHQ